MISTISQTKNLSFGMDVYFNDRLVKKLYDHPDKRKVKKLIQEIKNDGIQGRMVLEYCDESSFGGNTAFFANFISYDNFYIGERSKFCLLSSDNDSGFNNGKKDKEKIEKILNNPVKGLREIYEQFRDQQIKYAKENKKSKKIQEMRKYFFA